MNSKLHVRCAIIPPSLCLSKILQGNHRMSNHEMSLAKTKTTKQLPGFPSECEAVVPQICYGYVVN